ncbi:MAG: hypothetical protein EON47_03475 [Acetobacteraceae bacterium]|nr:MAG: hypothetical protein EON47_03475 [Acetobacteraceae bacterium]
MRLLILALAGLVFATAPMVAAEAAERPGGRQQRVQARVQAVSHAMPARSAMRPVASRRFASHQAAMRGRQVAVQRSAPMRGQLVVMRDQRAASAAAGTCTARRGGQCRSTRMNWTQGLSPAAGIQANECPDGTMATLARGHDDITRCMPI